MWPTERPEDRASLVARAVCNEHTAAWGPSTPWREHPTSSSSALVQFWRRGHKSAISAEAIRIDRLRHVDVETGLVCTFLVLVMAVAADRDQDRPPCSVARRASS
jgi:hypothetical protein